MSISAKMGDGAYHRVTQPYVKMTDNVFHRATRVLAKANTGWNEVWPGEIVYTHVGLGVNMNVAAAFGNPTRPGNYIFINNGTIQGNGVALVTGVLPAGSKLTIRNNGYIQGNGGVGGTNAPGGNGSDALQLQMATTLINNGYIFGGGGGGGAGGAARFKSRGSSLLTETTTGGNGQGPADFTTGYAIWYDERRPFRQDVPRDPTGQRGPYDVFDGGSGYSGNGGRWGQPGVDGGLGWGNTLYGRDPAWPGGAAGRAIIGSGYLLSSTGLAAPRVLGTIS